jgi:type II secretory pathway component PulF
MYVSFENLLAIIPLGAALVWAVKLAYGARAGAPDDWLKYCLHTSGWIMMLAGSFLAVIALSAGPMMIFVPVFWIVVLATLDRYRESERQSLLWTLAYAAERGVPLSYAARAFAQERTDEIGSRSWRLADALDRGLPLDAALVASRNRIPPHVLVATRVGMTYGRLAEMLKAAVTQTREIDRVLRASLERLVFMLAFLFFMMLIVSFIMIKIIPTFERMFMEFELELPVATKLLIALSQTFIRFWPLATLLMPVALAVMCAGVLYYVGWLGVWLPGVGWLRLRYDSSVLLRSLAVAVRQERSLLEGMVEIEPMFPNPALRARLRRAIKRWEQGSDHFDSLRRAGLITRYEQAVLSAAERVGNLPWALEAMADASVRRLTQRIRFCSNAAMTIAFICFSSMVLLFAVAMLQPLADLITNLA